MPQQITILGDGAMATVCSIILTQNGHHVTMWGAFEDSIERLIQNREQSRLLPGVKIPPTVRLTANDAECFAHCTMILSAIPTQYKRAAWTRLKLYVPANVPIVSVAKGIENDTLLRPTQIIADVLDERTKDSGLRTKLKTASTQDSSLSLQSSVLSPRGYAALSGPNIAAELAKYLPATAVAASEDDVVSRLVQSTFSTEWFRVYTNTDVIGVELAGAIKNVIAIAAGILDGLSAGDNAKAALVTRGLVEITRLGVAMGAREETFFGLAGIGDLITTCVSPQGRNRTVGERIGNGQKLADILDSTDSVAEGVPTTQSVRELGRRFKVEMPITESVYSVLFENKDVLAALSDLMRRDPKSE